MREDLKRCYPVFRVWVLQDWALLELLRPPREVEVETKIQAVERLSCDPFGLNSSRVWDRVLA
jgi:hypothetical protein